MKTQTTEILEAIQTGEKLLNRINTINAKLKEAKVWSVIDIFSRGGIFTSIFKHDNLDSAQRDLVQLQYELNSFNDELDDIKIDVNINDIAMSKGVRFSDWFFDGFFIDMYTLDHIRESQLNLEQLEKKVRQTLDRLNLLRTYVYCD